MTIAQVIVVAITVMLNAMDGFDILSIAFASNGIAAEWKVTTAALGMVLSMELVGMAIGSVFLGVVADRIGRSHAGPDRQNQDEHTDRQNLLHSHRHVCISSSQKFTAK